LTSPIEPAEVFRPLRQALRSVDILKYEIGRSLFAKASAPFL